MDYFQRELEKMEPEAVNTASVQAILKALPEIRSLVNVGYRKPVPLDNVKRLYQLSSELVQLIERG